MTQFLLATRNQKKLAELRRILVTEEIEILGLSNMDEFEEAPEVGATFEENALAKARDAYAATGLPTIADDSGLTVDALNGMPGVLSARWSGRHGDDQANLDLVLAQLQDVPDERRGAGFVCAIAFVHAGGEVVVRGEYRGSIGRSAHGTGGFGYDPIFLPEGGNLALAEMTSTEKDAASHRGQALRALVPHIRTFLN